MTGITRRFATAGLGALAAMPALPRRAHADLAALEDAARAEGTLTWYIASVVGDVAEAMAKRFTAHYPGIKVVAIRTTGQVAFERLIQELKNKTPQCDVYSSTDIAHYPVLKGRKALAHYVPQTKLDFTPAFQGLSDEGYFYPNIASLQVMVYHKEKVQGADIPRHLHDLLDPKWKGRVGIGHPAFSGYFGQWTVAVRNLYGWEFFEKLAKNNPRIGRSASDPMSNINAGECLIGTGPMSVALQNSDKGNPIGFVYPEDGSVLCAGPTAVMADAPHPNAARLFQEWLLSAEYGALCVEYHLESTRTDAPPMKGAKRLSEVKTIALTPAQIAKGIPEVIEQWRDTFGN